MTGNTDPYDYYAELFLRVDGEWELSGFIYREENHATGTVHWRLADGEEDVIYRRQTPNTADWQSQVRADILDLFPGQEVELRFDHDNAIW